MKLEIEIDIDESTVSTQEIVDVLEPFASFKGLKIHRVTGVNIKRKELIYPEE